MIENIKFCGGPKLNIYPLWNYVHAISSMLQLRVYIGFRVVTDFQHFDNYYR